MSTQPFFPTAKGSARTNSSNFPPSSVLGRTTFQINTIIPAGGTIPFPCTGNKFYFPVLTGGIEARPTSGTFVGYSAGTGLNVPLENTFNLLEVYNPNNFAVVMQLIAGFDGYIDNRLVTVSDSQPQVLKETYDGVADPVTTVNIPDISATEFFAQDLTVWLALSRTAVLLFNYSEDTIYRVHGTGGSIITPGNRACAIVPPLQAVRLDCRGPFKIFGVTPDESGSPSPEPVQMVVSEIYTAIPKTPTP